MKVKEYSSARAFLDDYEPLLLKQESVSQMVLYSAYEYCKNSQGDNVVFGAVIDEEKTYLLFFNVLPYNMVVYNVDPDYVMQVSEVLAEYLGSNRILINGIYAKYDFCQSFIEEYKKYINCIFVEKMGMDIMEIRSVNEVNLVDGVHRRAQLNEAKLAAEWIIEFQLEALANELDYEAALQRAIILINEGKMFFYENTANKVVSMAVAGRKLVHGVALTYVYTPEEHRGQGYAAANVYYLSKALLEQGFEFCTLFVDKKNPLSNRAYEKVGFNFVDDIYEYRVVSSD